MDPESSTSPTNNVDSIVLEEEIDPNYVPSEAEVVEYAKWLGMDLDADKDLYWIAREGLMAPLPNNWKPCKTKDTEDIYYFNFATGESTWDHPCDGYYKRLYEEEKKKKEISLKESNDSKRTQAKQDAQTLLGKSEKKKKQKPDKLALNDVRAKDNATLAPVLDRKPLPGIKGPLGPITSTLSGLSVPSRLDDDRVSQSRQEIKDTHEENSSSASLQKSNPLGTINSNNLGDRKPQATSRISATDDYKSNSQDNERGNSLLGNDYKSDLALGSNRLVVSKIGTNHSYSPQPKEIISNASEAKLARSGENSEGESKAFGAALAVCQFPEFETRKAPDEFKSHSMESSRGIAIHHEIVSNSTEHSVSQSKSSEENIRLAARLKLLEGEIQMYRDEIDRANSNSFEKIKSLGSELQQSKQVILQKDEEIYSLKRNIEMESLRYRELAGELSLSKSKTEFMEAQINSLQETVRTREAEVHSLNNKLSVIPQNSANASLDVKLKEAAHELATLRATNEYIEKQLALQRAGNLDKQRDLDNERAKNQSFQTDIEQLQRDLSGKKIEIESLQSKAREFDQAKKRIQEGEQEITQLKSNLQSKTSEVEALLPKLEGIEFENSKLREKLSIKDLEIRQLRQETESVLTEMKRQSLEKMESKAPEQGGESLSSQEALNKHLSDDLTAKIEEIRVLKSSIHGLERDLAKMSGLQNDVQSLDTKLLLRSSEIESLRESNNQLQLEIQRLTDDIRSKDILCIQTTSKLEALEYELSKSNLLQSQITSLKDVITAKDVEIQRLRNELVTQAASLQESLSEAIRRKDRLEETSFEQEQAKLTSEISKIQHDLRSKDSENRYLQKRCEQLENELVVLSQELRAKTDEVIEIQLRFEASSKQVEEEKESNNQKEKKLRGFREEVLHLQKLLSTIEQQKVSQKDDIAALSAVQTMSAYSQTEATSIETPKVTVAKSVSNKEVMADIRPSKRDSFVQTLQTRTFNTFVQTMPVELPAPAPSLAATAADNAARVDSKDPEIEKIKKELNQRREECAKLFEMMQSYEERVVSKANVTDSNKHPETVQTKSTGSGSAASVPFVHSSKQIPSAWAKETDIYLDSDRDYLATTKLTRNAKKGDFKYPNPAFSEDASDNDDGEGEDEDFASVSEVQTAFPRFDSRTLLETLGTLLSKVITSIYSLKARNAQTSRNLAMNSPSKGNQESAFRKLVKYRIEEETAFSQQLNSVSEKAKVLIRSGRKEIKSLKSDWKAKKVAKDYVNVVTNDLNVVIRFTRRISASMDYRAKQSKEVNRRLQQLSIASERSGKDLRKLDSAKILEAFKGFDQDLADLYEDISRLSRGIIRGGAESAVQSPASEPTLETIRFDDENFSVHRNMNWPSSDNAPGVASRRSVATKLTFSNLESEASSRPITAASFKTKPFGASHYRDKLDIIQRQLSSAQYQQMDSVKEYDRHFSWLGNLMKEVEQISHAGGAASAGVGASKDYSLGMYGLPSRTSAPLSSHNMRVDDVATDTANNIDI